MGFLPAALGVLLFNPFYVIDSRVRSRRPAVRILALLAIWLGAFAPIRLDAQPVMEWWLD